MATCLQSRPGGNSGAQDALRHEVEWHEGVRQCKNADLEVAAAAGSAGEYMADETPSAHAATELCRAGNGPFPVSIRDTRSAITVEGDRAVF